MEDTFTVQDEVARRIVAVLAVQFYKAETERALAKPPAAWLAYDHYLRARSYFYSLPFLVRQRASSPGAAQPGPGAGHRPQLRPGPCPPFQELYRAVPSPMGRCWSMASRHRRRLSVSSRGGAAGSRSVRRPRRAPLGIAC